MFTMLYSDESKFCPPMPIYATLTSNGYLSLFHMVNLMSKEDYPDIVAPAKDLSTDGERSAVPSNVRFVESYVFSVNLCCVAIIRLLSFRALVKPSTTVVGFLSFCLIVRRKSPFC